ncbi:DEAD/DEAH box helicase [Naasia lichenicola]|uniref:DEAD/DEAH box helicase n=1 Tax=Naasia lichenicola TaxID=2565933 RepID=A0A4S4FUR0_9MICO|nr:DEAD/DEAH box helicase [Naasia lichenicola]THG33356.1 DEAD/DEAH box helicase [Naasia lichenicola]
MDFVFSQRDILALTSSAAFSAAVPYVARDAVDIQETGRIDETDYLVAEVSLPTGELRTVQLTVQSVYGRTNLEAGCTCTAPSACEHVAAVLLALAARTVRVQSADGVADLAPPTALAPAIVEAARHSSSAPAKPPPWERALAASLGTGRRDTESAALLVELHDDSGKGGWSTPRPRKTAYLAARPATRGTRGSWIRSAVTWSRLDDAPIHAEQLDVLREFVALYRASTDGQEYSRYTWSASPDWMPLDSLPSRGLWSLIDAVRSAGIPIVHSSKSQPLVRFDDRTATARFDMTLARGRLKVGAEVEIDGETVPGVVGFLGSPAVGVAWIDAGTASADLVIARTDVPIASAVRDVLGRPEPLSIAGAQIEQFENDYLPRLQRLAPVRSSDASYVPPPPARPSLALTIQHEGLQISLDWAWAYGTSRPLRDRAVESEIAAAVSWAIGFDLPLVVGPDAAGTATLEEPASGPPFPPRVLPGANAAVFMAEVLPRLREVPDLRIAENGDAIDYRLAAEQPVVSIRTDIDGIDVSADPGDEAGLGPRDWLDLDVSVTVEGEKVPFGALFAALSIGDPVFLLPSGTYFPITGPEFDRLRAVIDEAKTLNDRPLERLRVSRYQVDLWQELVELGIVEAQAAEWQAAVALLADSAMLEAVTPPPTFTAELREYQSSGLAWMHFLRTNGLGGVLADDMGLGKTVQALAMMALAHEEQGEAMAPFLVVAPTSVVGNWVSEAERFAPALRAVAITETGSRRRSTLAEATAGAQIVVTSYALFRIEFEEYRHLAWSGLLLDEAQLIKNHTSRGYRCARLLEVPFKLAITGTPLENNLLELWSLVSLTCPGLLGGATHFTQFYRQPIERDREQGKLATLQRRIAPFLLRRTKDQVAGDLPPKQEQVLELDLHAAHRRIYDVRLQRERQKVLGLAADSNENRFQIFRSLTMLRQLALDASLVDETAVGVPSAKLDMLLELLVEAAAEGHRVLVFSQFTRFLGKARDLAAEVGLSYAYLDGTTARRGEQIDRFRAGEASVFFVSLKAGGFGLNLTEADYVILLDPWWNPATEAQAIDRTHRIGQTKSVMVYRLVTRNTIEQKVMSLQASKAQLFADVLDAEDAEVSTLSADDLRALLD